MPVESRITAALSPSPARPSSHCPNNVSSEALVDREVLEASTVAASDTAKQITVLRLLSFGFFFLYPSISTLKLKHWIVAVLLARLFFFCQRSFLDHLLHDASGGSGGNPPKQLVVAAAAAVGGSDNKTARTTIHDDALAGAGAGAALGTRTTIAADGGAARRRRATLGGAPEGRVRRF